MLKLALEEVAFQGYESGLDRAGVRKEIVKFLKEEREEDPRAGQDTFRIKAYNKVIARAEKTLAKAVQAEKIAKAKGKDTEKLRAKIKQAQEALREVKKPSDNTKSRITVLAVFRVVRYCHRVTTIFAVLTMGTLGFGLASLAVGAASAAVIAGGAIAEVIVLLVFYELVYAICIRVLENRISKRAALEAIKKKNGEMVKKKKAFLKSFM